MRKDTVQIDLCKYDGDCGKNEYCSFDDRTLKHQCVPNKSKMFYEGCLNTKKYNEFDKIESSSKEDHQNLKSCIDFVRRQKNKDGLHYNYMVYKNKKNSFVDLSTINVYLKCNDELLLVMPTKEFFHINCDHAQQKCILTPNETFFTFLSSNQKTCGGKLSLDIEYSCENENLLKKFKVPLSMKSLRGLKIDLTCPVNIEDSRFQSRCVAAYFDTQNSNPDVTKYLELLDKNIEPENCVQPVYKVPRIIQDKDIYLQLQKQKNQRNIEDYNEKLEERERELNKIRAEKLKIQYKNDTGKELDDREALRMVQMNKTEYFSQDQKSSTSSCNWKIHEHKNLFGDYLEENDIRKYATPFEGKIYMIEEAKNKACELNASMFVWFSNKYELSNLRNKLFVITPSQWDRIQKDFDNTDWSKWKKVNNVHVGRLTSENELLKEEFDSQLAVTTQQLNQYYNQFLNFFEQTVIHTDEKVDNNQNTLKNLEDKISTMTQDIKKNEYETNVHNQLMGILGGIIIIILILYVVYLAYKMKMEG